MRNRGGGGTTKHYTKNRKSTLVPSQCRRGRSSEDLPALRTRLVLRLLGVQHGSIGPPRALGRLRGQPGQPMPLRSLLQLQLQKVKDDTAVQLQTQTDSSLFVSR